MMRLYDAIVAFVARQTAVRADRIRPETTLFGDLRIDGDDGVELLEAFSQRFGVDMSACDFRRYFGPEGVTLLTPFVWLGYLFKSGSPESRAGLWPISIAHLVRVAELHRWVGG
jgi:acyl carrier protein